MTTTTYTPTEATSGNGRADRTPESGFRLSGPRLQLLQWIIENGPITKRGRRVSGSVNQQILHGTKLFYNHARPSTAITGAIHVFEEQGWVSVQRKDNGRLTHVEATPEGKEFAAERSLEIQSSLERGRHSRPLPEPEMKNPEDTLPEFDSDAAMPEDPFGDTAATIAALIESEADRLASHHRETIDGIRAILHSGGSPLSMLAQIEALL